MAVPPGLVFASPWHAGGGASKLFRAFLGSGGSWPSAGGLTTRCHSCSAFCC